MKHDQPAPDAQVPAAYTVSAEFYDILQGESDRRVAEVYSQMIKGPCRLEQILRTSMARRCRDALQVSIPSGRRSDSRRCALRVMWRAEISAASSCSAGVRESGM